MTAIVKQLGEMFKAWGVTHGDHKALLSFLIKTDDDLNEFMNGFYTGDILRDMMKYQKHKRDVFSPSFEAFDNMFLNVNKRVALEVLFQQPIKDYQIKYMDTYNVSHKELYARLQENSNESYLGLVKSYHPAQGKYNDDFLLTS